MSFIVYNTTSRLAVGAYQKLADANTAADVDANLIADTTDITLPDAYQPGNWYFTTGGLLVSDLPLSELDQVKTATRACHAQLLVWSVLLTEAAITQSAAHAAIGHDILFHGHQGVYITLHRTDLTVAQKILFAQQMSVGALDVTNPAEFFEHVHDVQNSVFNMPVVWVNPLTGARINFDRIHASTTNHLPVPLTGLIPTASQLAGGNWVESLTI